MDEDDERKSGERYYNGCFRGFLGTVVATFYVLCDMKVTYCKNSTMLFLVCLILRFSLFGSVSSATATRALDTVKKMIGSFFLRKIYDSSFKLTTYCKLVPPYPLDNFNYNYHL